VDPAQEVPLVVSATAAEVGDNTSRVDATVEGQATAIAFNSRFVADALGSLTASEARDRARRSARARRRSHRRR